MTSPCRRPPDEPHRSDAAADVVGTTLAALHPGDVRGLAEMRHAVEEFGRHAESAATPPQAMIVELKALFRATACRHQGAPQVEALLDRAVTWAIRGYYGHAGRDTSPLASAPPSPPRDASRVGAAAASRTTSDDGTSC